MQESLDEFEFRSDSTTDNGVSCFLRSENIVSLDFLCHFNSDFF